VTGQQRRRHDVDRPSIPQASPRQAADGAKLPANPSNAPITRQTGAIRGGRSVDLGAPPLGLGGAGLDRRAVGLAARDHPLQLPDWRRRAGRARHAWRARVARPPRAAVKPGARQRCRRYRVPRSA
jgi:hypothetical protein